MAIEHPEVEKIARRIFQEVSTILDRRQRTYALAKKLSKLSEEIIAEIFELTAEYARQKKPLFQDGYRVISDIGLLTHYLGVRKMSGVYTIARSKDYKDVIRIMSRTPPWRVPGVDEEPLEDQELKEMPLGQKKALARTRNRDLINRLLHDQNPAVIQILLQNPVLTIKEIIKIASKRPTNPQVLWQVYRNVKWINHYSVKKALVNNPYCPTQISLSLIHFLLEQDLEDIAENEVLHPRIQESAMELLLERRKNREAHSNKEEK